MLVAGCSSGDYAAEGPGSTPAPTTTAVAATSEVTVRGVVAQTLASARVVVLADPVSGFANIALTADTEVVRATGARASIGDILPRASVEVTGRPGGSESLIARRVVLL